nr:uncharacterized protein LOC127346898 [Lolium perenne]
MVTRRHRCLHVGPLRRRRLPLGLAAAGPPAAAGLASSLTIPGLRPPPPLPACMAPPPPPSGHPPPPSQPPPSPSLASGHRCRHRATHLPYSHFHTSVTSKQDWVFH